MNLPIEASDQDDDMPAEIDFSGGERGKFFREGACLNLPVYPGSQNQIEQAWAAEVERRIAAIERGELQMLPLDEVLAAIRDDLK